MKAIEKRERGWKWKEVIKRDRERDRNIKRKIERKRERQREWKENKERDMERQKERERYRELERGWYDITIMKQFLESQNPANFWLSEFDNLNIAKLPNLEHPKNSIK